MTRYLCAPPPDSKNAHPIFRYDRKMYSKKEMKWNNKLVDSISNLIVPSSIYLWLFYRFWILLRWIKNDKKRVTAHEAPWPKTLQGDLIMEPNASNLITSFWIQLCLSPQIIQWYDLVISVSILGGCISWSDSKLKCIVCNFNYCNIYYIHMYTCVKATVPREQWLVFYHF